MSYDQALENLSGELNSRLLVQEEHGFQSVGGVQCASPLATGAPKSLAWIGLIWHGVRERRAATNPALW